MTHICFVDSIIHQVQLDLVLSSSTTMASKHVHSGLGTVKRNWSEASIPSSSQDSNFWPPSPPPKSTPALTGAQQRLKDIQDALEGKSVSSEQSRSKPFSMSKQPLSSSRSTNKRPSSNMAAEAPPAKKLRQLPNGWDKLQSVPASSKISSEKTSSVASSSATTSTKGPGKIAPVFLSAEQTQILKLVRDGESVFYTGSAGTLSVFQRGKRELIAR